jgi:hypothetical protein
MTTKRALVRRAADPRTNSVRNQIDWRWGASNDESTIRVGSATIVVEPLCADVTEIGEASGPMTEHPDHARGGLSRSTPRQAHVWHEYFPCLLRCAGIRPDSAARVPAPRVGPRPLAPAPSPSTARPLPGRPLFAPRTRLRHRI